MTWLVAISFLFYSLNVTGFRVGNFILVTSCLKDEPVDLVFWVPYAAAVVTFVFVPHIGQWILLGIFLFFHIICFSSTYRYWLWPNEKKIASYNHYFSHTHHIIKPRNDVLIPDTFHITIFSMFLVNLIAILIYII